MTAVRVKNVSYCALLIFKFKENTQKITIKKIKFFYKICLNNFR